VLGWTSRGLLRFDCYINRERQHFDVRRRSGGPQPQRPRSEAAVYHNSSVGKVPCGFFQRDRGNAYAFVLRNGA
jgi:hypothetical protein